MTRLLRLEGFRVSFKRIQRIWRAEGLKVRRKPKKRRAKGKSKNACSNRRAQRANHVWCWDFIFDRTTNGQSLKWLSIVDEYTRRCITLDVSRTMTSEDVINRLAELFVMYGVPEAIRSDNGPRNWGQAKSSTTYNACNRYVTVPVCSLATGTCLSPFAPPLPPFAPPICSAHLLRPHLLRAPICSAGHECWRGLNLLARIRLNVSFRCR